MSEVYNPCISMPLSGKTLSIPFPSIARPSPGGWTVSLKMRSTDPLPQTANVALKQGSKTIFTTSVLPTFDFQTFDIEIGAGLLRGLEPRDGDLDDITEGVCNISILIIVITSTASDCCPETDIPDTLHVTSTTVAGCANCSVNPITTMTRDGNVWIGTAESCDRQWEIRLWCDPSAGGPSPWILRTYCGGMGANSPYFAATGSTCTPFSMLFPGCIFGSGNNICNCFDEHGDPKDAQVSFVITA